MPFKWEVVYRIFYSIRQFYHESIAYPEKRALLARFFFSVEIQ